MKNIYLVVCVGALIAMSACNTSRRVEKRHEAVEEQSDSCSVEKIWFRKSLINDSAGYRFDLHDVEIRVTRSDSSLVVLKADRIEHASCHTQLSVINESEKIDSVDVIMKDMSEKNEYNSNMKVKWSFGLWFLTVSPVILFVCWLMARYFLFPGLKKFFKQS